MTALDRARALLARGEIDGRDLRAAGVTATATAGFQLLCELEAAGEAVRTARGWASTNPSKRAARAG